MLHRKLHKKCFLEQKGMTCNHTYVQGSRFNRTIPYGHFSTVESTYKKCLREE